MQDRRWQPRPNLRCEGRCPSRSPEFRGKMKGHPPAFILPLKLPPEAPALARQSIRRPLRATAKPDLISPHLMWRSAMTPRPTRFPRDPARLWRQS